MSIILTFLLRNVLRQCQAFDNTHMQWIVDAIDQLNHEEMRLQKSSNQVMQSSYTQTYAATLRHSDREFINSESYVRLQVHFSMRGCDRHSSSIDSHFDANA